MVIDDEDAGHTTEPVLSVIVAAFRARATIADTLQSLRAQRTRERFEVIVVDSGDDGCDALVASQFPEVRLLHVHRRTYCGEARNLGLALARGSIIAFTDADCAVDAGWADALLEAHRAGHQAVGGAIANAEPSSLVGWAAYFTEFGPWLPGGAPRTVPDIAGANASYRRELLDAYGPFLVGCYCSDTAFNWRLQRSGVPLHFAPAAIVHHRSLSSLLRFLAHEVEHGRAFARVRAQEHGWSSWRRVTHAALGPALVPLLLARSATRVLASARHRTRWLTASPLLAAGVCSWCLGESLGYLCHQRGTLSPGAASAAGDVTADRPPSRPPRGRACGSRGSPGHTIA